MGGSNFVALGPIPDAFNDGVLRIEASLATVAPGLATTVIPAVAGKRIFLHAAVMTIGGYNSFANWLDVTTGGATVAAAAGVFLASQSTLVLPFSQYPWFSCAPGDALAITSSATLSNNQTRLSLMYVQG